MRIVLLGPPGSGKGKLSERIAAHYGVPIINASKLVDDAAAEQSELGRLAKDAMDQGRISDELLLALLRIRLTQADVANGFVLFDLPRNAGQADVIDSVLDDLGRPLELAMVLDVDPDELMERLVGRIACDSCGAEYNIYVNPPIVDGVCDMCGARVSRRPDDYEETISNRLRIYDGLLGPLLQYYKLNGKLKRIAGDGPEDAVWKIARKLIDATPRIQLPTTEELEAMVEAAPAARPGKSPKAKSKPKADKAPAAAKAEVKTVAATKPAAKKPAVKKAAAKQAVPKNAAASTPAKPAETKKATVKKAAAKKAAAKKVATKKAAVKKPSSKKAAVKKPQTKKAVAKKAAVKKAPAKAAAKKVVSKKAVVKKAAVKKAPLKKAVSKPVAKKTAVKKAVAKKAVAKKSVAKKAVAKKVPAKKAVVKKPAAKKTVAKKSPVKKVVAKKVAAKKVATKKAASRTPAAKKAPAKKAAKKKAGR